MREVRENRFESRLACLLMASTNVTVRWCRKFMESVLQDILPIVILPIVILSLSVSLMAVLISCVLDMPLGGCLTLSRMRGRSISRHWHFQARQCRRWLLGCCSICCSICCFLGPVGLVEQDPGEMRQRHRTALIRVTHNIFQARRVADRVALLLAGRIVEISARDDFFIGRLILGLRIL